MSHTCPIQDCAAHRHLLMCDRHWRMVPRDVQKQVYFAWNSFKRDPAKYGKTYFAISAAAIAVVHKKLRPKTEGPPTNPAA